MDGITIYMDYMTIHLAPLARWHPHPLPVTTIGYVPHKTDIVRNRFSSYNFSFILRGEGEYRTPAGSSRISAPCVITQTPTAYLVYGPDVEWEELYIIYPENTCHELTGRDFININRWWWAIDNPKALRSGMEELLVLCQEAAMPGNADRIDRLAERMILESLLQRPRRELSDQEKAVQKVREYLEEHYRTYFDFDEVALDAGYSPTHLRRLWGECIGASPVQYLTLVRMRIAKRMLAETILPVREIASAVGYDDPLYFSRRFKQEVGMTATRYRQRHTQELSFTTTTRTAAGSSG